MGNKTNRTSNTPNGVDNKNQPIMSIFITLRGETSVGKGSLVRKYTTGKFTDNFDWIIEKDCFTKQVEVKDKTVQIYYAIFLDEERHRELMSEIVGVSDGFLLVYDTARSYTFEKLGECCEEMRRLAPEAITFIIGARSDLSHKREVLFEEGQNFAKSENLEFFECSAKTGENVKEIFEQMTLRILEKKELERFIHPVKIETEGKSPEWKEDKYVPATRTNEEERGSANKTGIIPPKDASYPEDSDAESRAEVENMIVVKEDIIGAQSSSKLKPLELNENYHPPNDKKDVIPKAKNYMLSEEEMLMEGKCPAWFA